MNWSGAIRVGALVCAAGVSGTAGAKVGVVDLGVQLVDSCESTRAVNVNESGQVLVWCVNSGAVTASFLWDGAKMQFLGKGLVAEDINASGQVAGWLKGVVAYVDPVDTDKDGTPDAWFVDDGAGNNALLRGWEVRGSPCPIKADCTATWSSRASRSLFIDGAGMIFGTTYTDCYSRYALSFRAEIGGTLEYLDPYGPDGSEILDVNVRGDAALSTNATGFVFVAEGKAYKLGSAIPDSINDAGQLFGRYEKGLFYLVPADVDGDGFLDYYADANKDGINDLLTRIALPTTETGETLAPITSSFALNGAGQAVFSGVDAKCLASAYSWSAGTSTLVAMPAVTVDVNDLGKVLVAYKGEIAAVWDSDTGLSFEPHEAASALVGADPVNGHSYAEALSENNIAVGAVLEPDGKTLRAVLWNLYVVLPPDEQIDNIEGDIGTIVDGGQLSTGEGQALTAKLDASKKKLAEGNTQASCNLTNSFVKQVEAMMRSGRLDAAAGAALIADAAAVAASIGCAP